MSALYDQLREIGAAALNSGDYARAYASLCRALSLSEDSELWTQWALAQVHLEQADEAEAGFARAVELDPANRRAADRLGKHPHFAPDSDQDTFGRYFDSILPSNDAERSYFQTHKRRYLTTLHFLPAALGNQVALELGAAYHHLTPAITEIKGYSAVRCSDFWVGAPQTKRVVAAGLRQYEFTVDNFDLQTDAWPYDSASFHLVLCCEVLEHLALDPMRLLAEINRVLIPGGLLLLTTPNIASLKALVCLLAGESPYVYGKFERNGLATDRHNREYTPGEIRRLCAAGGFTVIKFATHDSWWLSHRRHLRHIAARGFSISERGDDIFCLAQKSGPVRNRFPQELYEETGTQAERRALEDRDAHVTG